ncbi:hypothetical protein FACS1894190_00320 [Spirochaetia bacterium]|nr:hypothetical protein FACS1894190_00320 [Spirochaetia bacterium]
MKKKLLIGLLFFIAGTHVYSAVHNPWNIPSFFYNHFDTYIGPHIGIWNDATKTYGFQIGVANISWDEFIGFQVGVFNMSSYFAGFALGAVNISSTMYGVQIGVVNYAHDGRGIQIGLVNYAQNYKGLQIGGINIHNCSSGVNFGILFNMIF